MKVSAAINLAIDAIRHEIKEKLWDAQNSQSPYGDRCRKAVAKWEEAIKVLEELKNER